MKQELWAAFLRVELYSGALIRQHGEIQMVNHIRILKDAFTLAFTLLLVGLASCASAPPLTDAGARVRAITAQQAQSCKFVRTVQYNDRIDSMGKTPSLMDAIGENNLRNAVGAAGANAYVPTKSERETFLGTVDYEGDAYICP